MKKDKATYILIFGLFAVYVLLIIIAFYSLENYSAVSAIKTDEVTIVLDAGHGGEDGGAVANNVTEKDINLSITKKLSELFKTAGFNVVTTRNSDIMLNTDGSTLRERKVSDMKHRLNLFNNNRNNVVISIHQNKFNIEKYNGSQVFYSPNNEDSLNLSEAIRKNIVNLLQPQNSRECKKATRDIYLLYYADVPAVLVECGFISNEEEALKLKDNNYQNKIAFAVYSGFLEYYNK
ncbi:MAG: N-acetylmuramoyl-L-alanine amidase [Ruminococcus sp.]|nr:N-acetylmuramoyl-L-alanine amidase [Ruminococcus sp.]